MSKEDDRFCAGYDEPKHSGCKPSEPEIDIQIGSSSMVMTVKDTIAFAQNLFGFNWQPFKWDDPTTWPEAGVEVLFRRELHPAHNTNEFFTGWKCTWRPNYLAVPWCRNGITTQDEDAPITHWCVIKGPTE